MPKVGFDVNATIDILRRKALELGAADDMRKKALALDATTPRQLEALALDVADPERKRIVAESAAVTAEKHLENPLAVATLHAFEHGVQEGRCSRDPCAVGAVCCALYEVATFKTEWSNAQAIITAAEEIETLGRLLATNKTPSALSALREIGEMRHKVEAEHKVAVGALHRHTIFCEAPATVVELLKNLQDWLEQFGPVLRDQLESSDLRQPRGSKGRPKWRLLTSIHQHLLKGGFDHRQIARLIPGSSDRARKQTKKDDARSLDWQFEKQSKPRPSASRGPGVLPRGKRAVASAGVLASGK